MWNYQCCCSKINETCENQFEIEKIEKFTCKLEKNMKNTKSVNSLNECYYMHLYACIWLFIYGCLYEWEKPLENTMMD